jgi:predicted double-glycine peptidase
MNINWLVIPTLTGALLLFAAGQLSVRRCRTFKQNIALSSLWLILGVPGFLLPLYYLHMFDDALWFYEFRSFPFMELTAMGAGLFAGALAELTKGSKLISRTFLIVILVLGIVAPHMKPILAPVASHRFSDRWTDDVCMQSTPSSCGAASAATIFRNLGESLSEQDVAKECFTYLGGTENWYIARAFRRRGYTVTYRTERGLPDDLRTPAIAGVRIGGVGHFIAILENSSDTFVTGDPLVGREVVNKNEINKKFDFTGFFMEIGRQG